MPVTLVAPIPPERAIGAPCASAAPEDPSDQVRRCDERGGEGHDEARDQEPIGSATGRGQQSKHHEREEIRRQRRSSDSRPVQAPGRDRGHGDERERDGQEPGREEHAADHTAGDARQAPREAIGARPRHFTGARPGQAARASDGWPIAPATIGR